MVFLELCRKFGVFLSMPRELRSLKKATCGAVHSLILVVREGGRLLESMSEKLGLTLKWGSRGLA